MKRFIFLIVFTIVCVAQPVSAQFQELFPENFKKLPYVDGDFGDYVWGVTIDDVKDIEYKKLTPLLQELDNAVFYQIRYQGLKSTISYEFDEAGKLYRGQINIFERQPDPQAWLDLLLEIQLQYTERYGKPIKEEFIWENQAHKPYLDEWRFALVQDHLNIVVQWAKEDTLITARLGTIEPFRPGLNIIFQKMQEKVEPAPQPLDLQDEQPLDELILP